MIAAYKNTNFAFILLVICKTNGIEKPPCSPYKDMCDTDTVDLLVTFTCTAAGCESSTQSYPVPTTPEEWTFENLDSEKCKQGCATDNTDACFYYKFREVSLMKTCVYMNSDQCTDWDKNGCEPSHCMSGEAEADSCEPNNDGVVPKPYKCEGSGVGSHQPGIMPNYVLRWNCFDHLEEVDIYTDDKIPGGTECKATPSCGQVEISYTCEDDANPNDDVGVWKSTSGPDSFMDNNKLTDPNCNAPDLTIDGYDTQTDFMEIQCIPEGQGPMVDGVIKAQNSCLMLCDKFPVLHFYTVVNEWKYINMLVTDDTEKPLPPTDNPTDNIIYCYKP